MRLISSLILPGPERRNRLRRVREAVQIENSRVRAKNKRTGALRIGISGEPRAVAAMVALEALEPQLKTNNDQNDENRL
jgi:hypothetical protein